MCTVSTQVRLGINVLYGLKQIHDIGFVHRDLKPANLAIGPPGSPLQHYIHILDFGLSREFIMQGTDGKMCMRRPRPKCLFRGTTRYCSLNTHDRGEQSRVDDLWSLIYLMSEMRGPLPWQNCKDKKEVADVKRQTLDKHLLYNSPVQLLEFVAHLRELSYYSRPNYRQLFDLLLDIMHDGNFKFTDPYDWELMDNKKPLLSKEKTEVMDTIDGTQNDKTKNTAASVEEEGTKHINVNDPLPQVNVGDPNNPFPPEEFETNPLGFNF